MIQALLASHNGQLYKRWVCSIDDIADLVRESHLEVLTSSEGRIAFWFTPSLHCAHRKVNRKATEIVLGTTRFTPRNVPLMRGIVVVTAHDSAGALASLSDEQIRSLAGLVERTPWWQDLVLSRRCALDRRRELRATRVARKQQLDKLP